MRLLSMLRHTVRAHLRTFIAAPLGAVVGLVLPSEWSWVSRALLGWDVFLLAFLLLVAPLATRWTAEKLRLRAHREDEGRAVILVLLLVASIASSFAIGLAIRPADSLHGWALARYATETGGTIVLSWMLIQTLFALHYARDWYVHEHVCKKTGGASLLEFPGDEPPVFSDFLYFAFTVGMTFQTSDVVVHGRATRRLVLLHGVIAFFFNTGIVALSINIVAGLLR